MTNSLKIKKICNQWKIFFASTNSPKINFINMCLFMFNALLFQFTGGLRLVWEESPVHVLLSFLWLEGVFLYFLRLYYNQTSLRFSKTLPCTKKLYTKYISICFEVLNLIPLIEWLILWGIFRSLGNDVSKFGIMFLFLCVVHLILSVGMPFTTIILSQEKKINMYSGMQKLGTAIKLLIYEFSLFGGFGGLFLLSNFLMKNVADYFSDITGWLICICVFIIITSCILNRVMFNKIYKK